ncbi:MAG: aldo/keto reductase [Defluviitaleaceae bacterium]|nr:aldo/keto reductase [Defluviitaleaceae bacterium]
MKYRVDMAGNKLSALGMGCMRFPRDKSETERMILAAIDGGVNFFDTAYIYPGSEATLGDILAKHDKRKDVFIATKLPVMFCKSAGDFDKYFDEQLRRLKTDYIDYYFIHSLPDFTAWERLLTMGIESWLAGKVKAGKIHQVGFSFHGSSVEFLKILDAYPWAFTMIQYNYYDENYQAGKAGLHAAAEKGVAVMIMEPLLGGQLATSLPKQAVDMFAKLDTTLTPADWALWWLWNHPEVTVVVSGMKNTQILESNLRSVDIFRPLSQDELAVYVNVVELFKKSYKINCTACNYCLPCPKGINIPACLSVYNTSYLQGYSKGLTLYATSTAVMTKNPNSPRLCNGCGKCEKICPQNIPIRKELKKVAKRFEPLPVRLVLALVRRIMGV